MKILYQFLFLAAFCISTQQIKSQISTIEIDSLINEALHRFNVVGASVAIVKDGKTVHSKGYGYKSINSKNPVDENTNFAIASNSKAFTTAALSILVEEDKLKWDDKVIDYIPEFRMYNPYVTANFNIIDLVTHRSGLGLGAGDLMFFPDGGDFTIDDILEAFQYFQTQSAFRTQYDYDNLLYFVAGEIIKRISGISWEEFVSKRIFVPLGMHNTYPDLDEIKNLDGLATAHASEKDVCREIPHMQMPINGAAGGIYSNVNDLCKWMLVHLNQGRYGDSLELNLFSESNQKLMWRLHTVMDVRNESRYNSHFKGYGLGWFLQDKRGYMFVEHTGGLPGMSSKILLIPDINLGVCVLTNTGDGGAAFFYSICNAISDKYLLLDDYNWIGKVDKYFKSLSEVGDSITTQVWSTVDNNKEIEINHNKYIGIYKDPWFGKMEVFLKEGQLWMKSYRSPKLNGAMHFYKANAFAIKWEYQDMNGDAFAIFTLNEEGEAIGIKMKGISPNIDFSFDFQDLNLEKINK